MCFLFFYGGHGRGICAETDDGLAWKRVETKYTIIHYLSEEDLTKFNRRINYGPNHWGLKRLFSDSESNSLTEHIRMKVDLIFERVQEILQMRKKMKKVNIHIYPDKNHLKQAFTQIYRKPCRIRAWYRHRNNTVYLNVRDLHKGMLAHELAHAIVDHYLLVRPPRATAEILARYVDKNL
jgi:hypothetical protein